MSNVIDTSAFLLGKHRELENIKTTYQVIHELDHLKEEPRTRHR